MEVLLRYVWYDPQILADDGYDYSDNVYIFLLDISEYKTLKWRRYKRYIIYSA
jgi:hypothetical protein